MGANRAQRRRQERAQIKDWKSQGEYSKLVTIMKNGLGQKDLDEEYNKGYTDGYTNHAKEFMRKMYAAMAKELIEAGNSRDDVVEFIKGVDHRFAVMYDAEDEIDEVYNLIGVYLNVDKNALNHVEEVAVG